LVTQAVGSESWVSTAEDLTTLLTMLDDKIFVEH
jgi:hypothetical protein